MSGMSDSERRDFFEAAFRGAAMTPKDREIERLKAELQEVSRRASAAVADAAELRALFMFGWREDEDQWRLTKAAVLASGAAHLVKR